jgi:hypothetical protein
MITMEQFITKAKSKHENKYDYSKVKYVNAKTKIVIICPYHKEFEQTPDNHLHSNGCKECSKKIQGISRRLTHDEFLQKASNIHGDTYDYSEAKYERTDIPITIICIDHGKFTQTPNAHLCGHGCDKCRRKENSDKKRKTREEFLKEAIAKHGLKFDYSEVVYINTHTHIIIKCPDHGVFTQSPIDHISSMFGCKKCADKERGLLCRSNTDEFVVKSILIHGDKYDYTKVKYVSSDLHVIIKCSTHGSFLQLPAVHLRGNGCPLCGIQKMSDSNRYTNEEFIEEAIKKHGDLYNYDSVEYVTSHIKIIIECPKHGEFVQTPNSHLSGSGCPLCGQKIKDDAKRKTPEQFIKDAIEIHGDKYDYSKVVYINSTTPVIIICPTHGDFEQTPGGHLCGGCKECANVYIGQCRRKSQEKFIEEVSLTHNNKYNYDKVVYINSKTNIIITCPHHGDFTQIPANHWCGKGCSKCIGHISKISLEWLHVVMVNRPALLFEYRIPNTRFYADAYDPDTNTIYEFHGDYWHGNPTIYAPTVYNSITQCTMGNLYHKTQEKKRRCIELGYKYVEMWENQWNHFKKFIRMVQIQFRKRKSNLI